MVTSGFEEIREQETKEAEKELWKELCRDETSKSRVWH
jgi:hypothetical protein